VREQSYQNVLPAPYFSMITMQVMSNSGYLTFKDAFLHKSPHGKHHIGPKQFGMMMHGKLPTDENLNVKRFQHSIYLQ